MNRALTSLLALTAACALCAGSGSPAQARVSEDCRTRGLTIVANDLVRVYARDNGAIAHVYYACDVPHRRARLLGRWDRGEGGVSRKFGLSGRFVAYEYVLCEDPGSPCSGHVDVLNVAANRTRLIAQSPGRPPWAPATDLLLSPKGTVVWIRAGEGGPSVSKADSKGTLVLDAGPGVDAGSLAQAGSRFYWTRGGAAQSAIVP